MKSQDRVHHRKIVLETTIAAELRNWRMLTGGEGLSEKPAHRPTKTRAGPGNVPRRRVGACGRPGAPRARTPRTGELTFLPLAELLLSLNKPKE